MVHQGFLGQTGFVIVLAIRDQQVQGNGTRTIRLDGRLEVRCRKVFDNGFRNFFTIQCQVLTRLWLLGPIVAKLCRQEKVRVGLGLFVQILDLFMRNLDVFWMALNLLWRCVYLFRSLWATNRKYRSCAWGWRCQNIRSASVLVARTFWVGMTLALGQGLDRLLLSHQDQRSCLGHQADQVGSRFGIFGGHHAHAKGHDEIHL